MSADNMADPGTRTRTFGRARIILLVVAAVLAVADLALKALAEAKLSTGVTTDFEPVGIRLLYNPGVAFSFGAALPAWVVITATGLIIGGLIWFTLKTAPTMTRLSLIGAALLLGGALGNFIDRLDGKGVVDYLHTGWFATFNLADVFVTMGVVTYLLGAILTKTPTRNEDAAPC